jgi:hypothetical protein
LSSAIQEELAESLPGDIRARLDGADLTDAHVARANLADAHLTSASLFRADLTSATLTGARWPEGTRVPDGWMIDSDSSRLKPRGQLSEVMTHYL